MFSRFFIDRPIFAAVLSITIALCGMIALINLPLSQYPSVSPPTVSVDCNYPGASAQVVAESVAAPIEQQVNGVERMLYMSSQCTNDGSYSLTVTFEHGVDLNLAQVLVQNRVNLALPQLPDVLKATGVTTRKRPPDILMAVNINCPDNRYDALFLSNYTLMYIRDELARLPGISDIFILGEHDYAMRVWVDPEKLAARSLTAMDVVNALQEQNAQVATGQIGQPPAVKGQQTQITLSTLGRLSEPEQFADVIIHVGRGGRVTRIRDIGHVELAAKAEDLVCTIDGKPSVGLVIWQLPDANALDVADAIRAKMDELQKDFPPGVVYEIQYDTTPYTRHCIEEVKKSLRDAIILVAFVVLLFLQNWRSAIIPLVAVPVAIVGTFAVMLVLGFSLNNLTLFGLVLAIGIVVDDAIVVVEAVEHHIEHGLQPREATIRAMDQVSGPVIAVGLVLSAVFIPCAFITGIMGQFYRQFALTIASSTIISAFNSLTLSPALAALLLRSRDKETHEVLPRLAYVAFAGLAGYFYLPDLLTGQLAHWPLAAAHPEATAIGTSVVGAFAGGAIGWLIGPTANVFLGWAFDLFNRCFHAATGAYTRIVGMMLRVSVLVLLAYAVLLGATWYSFTSTPTGFVPNQDMGYAVINIQTPDATSAEVTRRVVDKVRNILNTTPGVKHSVSIAGQSFFLSAYSSFFGSLFLIFDDFDKRRTPNLYSEKIIGVLQQRFAKEVPEAIVAIFGPTPIRGVGRSGGFKIMLEDQGETSLDSLQEIADNYVKKGMSKRWPLSGVGKLSPDDRTAAEIQRYCPVDHALLGSKGDVQRSEYKGAKDANPKPYYFCSDDCKTKFAAAPDKYIKDMRPAPPLLDRLINVFSAKMPQQYVDMDRKKCMAIGGQQFLSDAFSTMQIYLGSLYVNDFNRFGRTWQVIVQADAKFRNSVEQVKSLKVRNANGSMVPLGTVMRVQEQNGPLIITRYNMHLAAGINGVPAPGISSGQSIDIARQIAHDVLPAKTMTYEFTDLAFLELASGKATINLYGWLVTVNVSVAIFSLASFMVFLVLAAQYESWSLPLAVILVVPMCLLSAVIGVWFTPVTLQTIALGLSKLPYGWGAGLSNTVGGTSAPMDINIFTQIGLVVLVGLASKNAILIVEYAKRLRSEGASAREATLTACRLRLRPIIMTSFAFILGVVPLLLSTGAGAEMRRTLGTAVFAGMLGVTFFGIFLTPVFFSVIDWLSNTTLFHSRYARRFGDIALAILFPWMWWRLVLRRPVQRTEAIEDRTT